MSSIQQPVLFLSHGAGPSFYLDARKFPMMKGLDKNSPAAEFLRNLTNTVKICRPRAILVLSAHWEESTCKVQVTEKNELYYDYGGFPSETYKISWPVPGSPDLARRAKHVLESKGIKCEEVSNRGLDHGVFVPLKLVFPEADIPVFQVSLISSVNIEDNLKIGEALSDLSSEDILIIGSGFPTHSGLRDPSTAQWAKDFKKVLNDVITNPKYTPEERKTKFIELKQEPSFPRAHPSLDHFLPIGMCLAAAGYRPAKIIYSDFVKSLLVEHYLFPTS